MEQVVNLCITMTFKGLYIQLDDPMKKYFAGEIISGRVGLGLDESVEFKSISVTFDGTASVQWSETRTERVGFGSRSRTEHYTVYFESKETHLFCRMVLFGNDNGSERLSAGNYIWPFRFALPIDLPSSFSGTYGGVHYSLEARMKRAWLKADMTATLPFTVNGVLDLNLRPWVAQPEFHENEKNVCCLCCKSGPVGCKVSLQRTGFVPGESITISGEFVNFSKNRVKSVSLDLIQITIYHAEGRRKTETETIASSDSPPIEPGATNNWGGEIFKVPSVPPTALANCKIIDLQYELEIKMNLSGLTRNLSLSIPITIGTIPLKGMSQQQSYNALAAPIPEQWK